MRLPRALVAFAIASTVWAQEDDPNDLAWAAWRHRVAPRNTDPAKVAATPGIAPGEHQQRMEQRMERTTLR